MADGMTTIERAVEAAWSHLESRYDSGKGSNNSAYVSRELSIIDGTVDMSAIARAVIAAIRELSEEMIDAAEDQEAQSSRGTARNMWITQIDALLEEEK